MARTMASSLCRTTSGNLGNLLWLHLRDTHDAEAHLQHVVAKLDANMDKIAAFFCAKAEGKEAEQQLRAEADADEFTGDSRQDVGFWRRASRTAAGCCS